MSCGAAFAPRCPSCNAENPPQAKFCIECGTDLGAPAPSASPEAIAPAAPEAAEPLPEERRQVSVLFADLSGYTGYAEQTDPEAVKQLLDRTLRKLGEEVTRFGGSIDKYIGDNVMAVFGAPVAHEDDPERAVRAGLAMQVAMERLNEKHAPQSEVNFMLRVGINTGEVLAGRMGDGYTGYAEQTDPETVKQLLDNTLRKLGEEVTRFGGSIDKYIGDNVMAVFGLSLIHI